MAGNRRDWEFQRLHGMGEALYEQIVGPEHLDRPCRDLCAGRQPRGSAPLPGAAAARKRRQHLVCQPHRRRPAADRRDHRRSDRAPRAIAESSRIRASRCRATFTRRSARMRAGSTSTIRRALDGIARRARRGAAAAVARGADHRRHRADRRRRARVRPERPAAPDRRGGRRPSPADVDRALARAVAAPPRWDRTPAGERAAMLEARGRSLREPHGGADGADRPGRRPHDPGRALRGARGGRLPALLRGARAGGFCRAHTPARPGRRAQRDRAARARRLRLHLAVEFPAGDLHRPDRGGARRRQRGRRQARRADAADRRRRGAAAARGGDPRRCPPSAAGDRRGGRRAARRRPAHRRDRLYRLDRDGARISTSNWRAGPGRSCRSSPRPAGRMR